MNWQWASIDNISDIDDEEFNLLVPLGEKTTPFLNREFLKALEQTHCVSNKTHQETGWQVCHIVIRDANETLIAFLPAYLKSHSYGEYVFDHSWAHAYHQHGLNYYPKLVVAIPFTPVPGTRVLVNPQSHVTEQTIAEFIAQNSQTILDKLQASSLHILFPEHSMSQALANYDIHPRQSVQFNWYNHDYESFEHYLEALTARRRRTIKKERKNVAKQGISLLRLSGEQIESEHMQFFYRCYQQTYLKRSGHTGYLNHDFFENIFQTMKDNILLVIAKTEQEYIAAALFFFDQHGLYGRYWGSVNTVEVSGLHFEACYYQGIEFCIQHKINYFNPGTQGEHKILRGFAPTICYSNHKMKNQDFDKAVADFVTRERPQIEMYAKNASTLLPFKN